MSDNEFGPVNLTDVKPDKLPRKKMIKNMTINEVKIILTVEHNGTTYTKTRTRASNFACRRYENIPSITRYMASEILKLIEEKKKNDERGNR